MPKHTWTIAGLITGLLALGLLGMFAWQQRSKLQAASVMVDTVTNESAVLRTRLDDAEITSQERSNRLAELEKELVARDAAIAALQREKEEGSRAHKEMEEKMRSALQSKDVTISELQGKLTVNILDRILFDSGEAVLKPEGEKVLEQIAEILEQYPERQIHVIGHTDNVPIRVGARSRFASNWELSTARATAAVRFLQEKAGVAPQRLGAVGYGEFQPVADNATTEGRARNRRIALVVLPEIMAQPERLPGQKEESGAEEDDGV